MGYTIELDDGTILFFRHTRTVKIASDENKAVRTRVFEPRVIRQASRKEA